MNKTEKKNSTEKFARTGVQTEKMLDVIIDGSRTICTEVMAVNESEVLLKSDEILKPGTKVSLIISETKQVSGEITLSRTSEELGMFEVKVTYEKMENFINVFCNYIDFSGIRKFDRGSPKSTIDIEIWEASDKSQDVKPALLIDLSSGGLKIKTLKALSTGSFIKIKFKNNSMRLGEVRWSYEQNESYKPSTGEATTLIYYYAGIMFITEEEMLSYSEKKE